MSNTTMGICLILCTQVMIWFAANTQFMSEQYSKHSFLICMLLSIPISCCAYYATRYMYRGIADESLWSVRLIIFGISTLTFAIMTSTIMHETLWTAKTLVCILLSIAIVWIQVAWQ